MKEDQSGGGVDNQQIKPFLTYLDYQDTFRIPRSLSSEEDRELVTLIKKGVLSQSESPIRLNDVVGLVRSKFLRRTLSVKQYCVLQ